MDALFASQGECRLPGLGNEGRVRNKRIKRRCLPQHGSTDWSRVCQDVSRDSDVIHDRIPGTGQFRL